MSTQTLLALSCVITNESLPTKSLQRALDQYARICTKVTNITPNPGFTQWADDTLLASGVAINPQSAAYCLQDYQRSIVFIRGIYAAILDIQHRSPSEPVNILYAGCGPYATLMLPLLVRFRPDELNLFLVDIHQTSLDSVRKLLTYFGLDAYSVTLIQADASGYQHFQPLQLIVAEVMQKALEQEPQFAVTANLAPQLSDHGVFIPQAIHVTLCLALWAQEKEASMRCKPIDLDRLYQTGRRHKLADIFSLRPSQAAMQNAQATYNTATSKNEINLGRITIPNVAKLANFDALLLTQIEVYAHHRLDDYASNITLPHKCYELSPLRADACFSVSYQLGSYPKFEFTPADTNQD